MHIDSYSFGRIVIDGREYTDDVIITPAGIEAGWWRAKGHDVSLFDLAEAFKFHPARLIIGTGASAQCRVLHEVAGYCKKEEIELFVAGTPEAIAEYNTLEDKSKTVAALHLTC